MKQFLLLAALLLPAILWAQTPLPVIRAKLLPADQVIVGQPVRLVVEVFVPNFFTGAPEFPLFALDGAIVTLSDDRPEHLNDRINGVAYAGIRRFYLIYPEQPGAFVIPAVALSIPYAAKPPETTRATLNLPPLTFTAVLPREAQGLDYFLPTSQLTLRQDWSGPLTHLRVGDSVSRTVVVTAQKMQAMLIPPLPFSAPEGIRVYVKNPSVENKKSEIGEFLAGVRTERASYVFTKSGDYVLPEVDITWWDLGAQKLKTSKIPPTDIHIDSSGAYVPELPPEPLPETPVQATSGNPRRSLSLALKASVALLLLALLALALDRWGAPLLRHFQSARERRQNSEPAHWRRLKQALHRNDASLSYALLLAWVRRACRDLSLPEFLESSADPDLDQQILRLSQTLFGQPQPSGLWHGGLALAVALSRHRRSLLRKTSAAAVRLPPLNPE